MVDQLDLESHTVTPIILDHYVHHVEWWWLAQFHLNQVGTFFRHRTQICHCCINTCYHLEKVVSYDVFDIEIWFHDLYWVYLWCITWWQCFGVDISTFEILTFWLGWYLTCVHDHMSTSALSTDYFKLKLCPHT